MAKRINELTDHENARYVETLALAFHLDGQPRQAVKFQRTAVTLLAEGESPRRARMEARLAEFEVAADGSLQ